MIKDKEIEKLIGGDGKQEITGRTEKEYKETIIKLKKLIYKRVGIEE